MTNIIVRTTLKELKAAFSHKSINFVVTRYNKNSLDDLDILLLQDDFDRAITNIKNKNYNIHSHDHALGGRVPGAQVNLVKKDRIKIDLHQDFTWRKSRYMELKLIWNNLQIKNIAGVEVRVPRKEIDTFLILINIIFEKTYILKEDFELIDTRVIKVFGDKKFNAQAKQFGWISTWMMFKKWYKKREFNKDFPVFLPFIMIIFSYGEKLVHDRKIDLKSLAYYFFFRTRYLLNKKLPYS